jgi:hypothetical protein
MNSSPDLDSPSKRSYYSNDYSYSSYSHEVVSVKSRFPNWLIISLQHISTWLFWPFIGGLMYGLGEVTAREFMARKYKWGLAPSQIAKNRQLTRALEKSELRQLQTVD